MLRPQLEGDPPVERIEIEHADAQVDFAVVR